MIDAVVTTANVHDTKGAQRVLKKAKGWLEKLPEAVFAANGYQGGPFASWVSDKLGAEVKTSPNPAMIAKQFVPVKKRWVVERAFAWFGDYRRLDKEQKRKIAHSTALKGDIPALELWRPNGRWIGDAY